MSVATSSDRLRSAQPSTGRARYVMLAAVLLLAGVFSGLLLHDQVLGQQWATDLKACTHYLAGQPDAAAMQQFLDCTAPAQFRRAAISLGGGVAVLLVSWALLYVLPRRLMRRAGPFTPAARWSADTMSLGRKAPEVVFGRFSLREAFTIRAAGRTRVVLPPGVARLPEDEANALVRHELAHVAAGDVRLVWLIRAVWWAVPPVLALPVIAVGIRTIWSGDPVLTHTIWNPFWAEYVVRAVLLVAMTAAIAASVLRSREHEADLRSCRDHPSYGLKALLTRSTSAPTSRWQRLRALHPTVAQRIAVLDRGELLDHGRLIEGIAFGALATMIAQATTQVVNPLLSPANLSLEAIFIAACVGGLLLSLGWGTALWQLARGSVVPRRHLGALVGLPVGGAIGLLLDLSGTGTFSDGPSGAWPLLLTVPLAVGSAGGLSIALARLCWPHSAKPRYTWLLAGVVNTVLFVGALWIGYAGGIFVAFTHDWLIGLTVTWQGGIAGEPLAVGMLVLGVVAWWRTPGRLMSVVTAVVAAVVVVAGRWILPSDATTLGDVLHLDLWTAAAAAAAGLIAGVVTRGRAGLVPGLATAVLAALLAAVALALRHGITNVELGYDVSVRALAATLLVNLAVGLPAGLLPHRESSPRPWAPLAASALCAT
ncbi:MAG TPA: M48 family metalloprotease, partial [Kutzneria sp.]|nr:M48 family metalloprotease [Kutzneria sp.]